MAVLKTIKIKSSLTKKGFVEETGRDHIVFHYLDDDGRKTTSWTKYSHGESEVSDILIQKMAKQTQLTRRQFEELVNCHLSKEEYHDILKKKKII